MGRIVGIDIGSTNCVVAVADEPDHGGHACLRVVEIDGCGEIPCVIALGSDRRIVVGDRAKKLAARGVPALRFAMAKLGQNQRYTLGDHELSMRDILGNILAYVKRKAAESLDDAITGAVVTHPVWLGQVALDALRVACEEPGEIPVLGMLSDAAAAVRALLHEDALETGPTLVYHLGGQTCAIALLETERSELRIVGTTGDLHLGGIDIDALIARYVLDQLEAQGHALSIVEGDSRLCVLMQHAENAKCSLSQHSEARIRADAIFDDDAGRRVDIECEITRSNIDQMVEPLVAKTIELSKACLADRGLDFNDLGNFVAMGGSSAIPVVRERLEQSSGRPLARSAYIPGQVAASGAALHAAELRLAMDEPPSNTKIDRTGLEPGGKDDGLLHVLREEFRQKRVEFHQCLQELGPEEWEPFGQPEVRMFIGKGEALEREIKVLFDRTPRDLSLIERQLAVLETHLNRCPRPVEWQPPRDDMLGMLAELEHILDYAQSHLPDANVRAYGDMLSGFRRRADDAYSARDTATWQRVAESALELRSHLLHVMPSSAPSEPPPAPVVLQFLLQKLSTIRAEVHAHGPEAALADALQRAEAAAMGVDLSNEAQAIQALIGIYKQQVEPVEGRLREMEKTAEIMPAAGIDRVHFSVTTVSEMAPEQSYPLDVCAHLKEEREEVLERARDEALDGQEVRIRTKGPVKVARGAVLTVTVRIEDWTVDPPQDTIEWEGEAVNAQFIVTVPKDATIGNHPGVTSVHIDGLKVVRLSFLLQVGAGNDTRQSLDTESRRFRSAFASYDSADRDAVLARIQGILKAAPEMDIFLDVVTLRSGQNWHERIEREILSREVLYLFWSKAASQSDWVKREWEFALEERGIDFIDPVPLVSPEIVPPPKRLCEVLHFNDWMLAYMRSRPQS